MSGPTVFMPFPDGVYMFNVPVNPKERPYREFVKLTPIKPGYVRIQEILDGGIRSEIMSDIEKLMQLFTEFGIGFTTELDEDGTDVVRCYRGEKKIDGYRGFYTDFHFDENGKFSKMEILE